MASELTEKIIQVILDIPPGKVMTYSGVARAAGHPGGARQVSWTIHSCTKKYNLPWFRVINAKGRISLKEGDGYEIQRGLLEDEGVVFRDDGSIDLSIYSAT